MPSTRSITCSITKPLARCSPICSAISGFCSDTHRHSSNFPPLRRATCTIIVVSSVKCGDFITYTQGGWGTNPAGNNPGALLANNFKKVAGGGGAVLKSSSTNPTSSGAGVLAALGLLRTTDLAEVAAIVAPRQLVFLTPPASEFDQTRAIYKLYGRETAFRQAAGLSAALELP